MRSPNDTLVQGSPTPRRPQRTGTAAFPSPPAPPRRLADDLEPPTSIRNESAWFEPAVEPMRRVPISHDLEERKGWSPPRSSQGLVFAGVSFVLVGVAIAGTVFFLSPEQSSSHHTTVTTVAPAPPPPPAETETSTPTTTGADLTSASASAAGPSIAAPARSVPIRLGDAVEPAPKPKPPAASTQAPPTQAATPHAIAPKAAPHHVVQTHRTTPVPPPADLPPTRPPERTERSDLFDTPSGLDEPKPAPTTTTTTTAPAPTTDPSSQF